MNKIKIFQREIEDGVGDTVASQASIAYCTEAVYRPDNKLSKGSIVNKILAENKDQMDLYYLEAVLVSTGWNRNDDVFLNSDTWAARATPEDKQFNFMHNENDIIGHITGSYIVDKLGHPITASASDVPKEFDIVTQAVIYNSWMQDENKERMEQIIAEIEEGDKWYVSMECLFAGFDYALIGEDGQSKLLERNEASAFLTKHLRCYGGLGEYEGYKVGRALRNISFSGKGLVSKPANPDSVILSPKTKSTTAFIANANDNSVNFNTGDDTKMADENVYKEQLDTLKADLKEAVAANKAIKADIETAKDKEFASTIESHKAAVQAQTDLVTAKQEELDTVATQLVEANAKIEVLVDLQKELDETKASLEAAEAFKAEAEKAARTTARVARLVEAGLEQDKAEVSCAALDALEDEAFESFVISAFPPKKMGDDDDKYYGKHKKDKDKKDAKKKDAKAELNLSDLDGLESSEASLQDGTDDLDEKTTKLHADVAEWFGKLSISKESK